MWVPVNSSMLRAKRGSSMLGGPPLSPSAITLFTGVSWVTDRMPIRARITPKSTSAAIAMYLISVIFSWHDLRGPSANPDACYRPRPVAGIPANLSIERFRRGHGDLLLSRERWEMARFAQPRRPAARHLRPRCLYRAPSPLPRGGSSGRRYRQLYTARLSPVNRPPRRWQNI